MVTTVTNLPLKLQPTYSSRKIKQQQNKLAYIQLVASSEIKKKGGGGEG